MVIMAKFDMKQMMETIVKFKCDELWLVPRESALLSVKRILN